MRPRRVGDMPHAMPRRLVSLLTLGERMVCPVPVAGSRLRGGLERANAEAGGG